MRHVTEEELVEHYYGESSAQSGVALHLELCSKCAKSYETLCKDLEGIEIAAVPLRGADFGDQVWEKLRNSLPVYEKKESPWSRMWNWKWRPLGYGLTCAVLILAAFVIGRNWERHQKAIHTAGNTSAGQQRVVLFVAEKHLERSERLLIELNHANSDEPEMTQPIQSEARKLLADNRLYLQSSSISTDPTLSGALDHLQRVLVEVANDPNGLNQDDIARLQKEMNTRGLLFEIRVLKTKAAQATVEEGSVKKGLAI